MSLVGKIVEYIDQGRFLCAVGIEETGNRLRMVNQNGREVLLPHSRLVHVTSRALLRTNLSREELQKELKAVDEVRRALMSQVTLEEIWELASIEADSRFLPLFLAELCFGAGAGEDHEAAFLRRIFDDRMFFKYKDGQIIAHSVEVVEQLRGQQEKERQREALLVSGAVNLRLLWEDKAELSSLPAHTKLMPLRYKAELSSLPAHTKLMPLRYKQPDSWPDRDNCLNLLREYYLYGNEAAEHETTRELLKQADLTQPHDPFHLLVKAGVWERNENIPLLRYNMPVIFNPAVLAAAEIKTPEPEILLAEGRKDFRHLPIITIDSESTRDLDDALHIEKQGDNYLVGIHIADVASLVRPGEALFQEAQTRVSSLYLPDQRIAMLPESLSEGACSLIVGKPRAAMSFMVLLAADGEVLDYDIVASVVEVKQRLSYDAVEKLITTDDMFKNLFQLSTKLLARRLSSGALLMPIPDVGISFGPDGTISIGLFEVDSKARSLVAEFMVLANSLAARFVAERQVPGLFRSQPEPHRRLIQGIQKDLFINFRQRRFLAAAKLSTAAEPHSCVGVMQYTTVTSPIRRFLDLIMQHQIFNLLRGKGMLFTAQELLDFARVITVAQTRLSLVRQLRQRYWVLKYLEAFQGRRVAALVLDKNPRRLQLVLTETLLDCDLPVQLGKGMEPGDVVSVRISKVSALDDLIKLEI